MSFQVLQRVTVTPGFCDLLIKNNGERLKGLGKQQRHVDGTNLRTISRDLENGTFSYPQDTPLAFTSGPVNGTGRIEPVVALTEKEANTVGASINGMHRITACAQTQKSFEADVWLFCPPEMIHLFDRAKTRTFRDSVEIDYNTAHSKSAGLSSIVTRAARYIASGNPFSDVVVTRNELQKVMDDNEEILEEAVEIGSRAPFYKSVYGLVYFIGAINGYAEQTKKFLTAVRENDSLEIGSPEYQLRQKLYEKERDQLTRRPQVAALLMTFALRHYVFGTTFKKFNTSKGFEFPDGITANLTPQIS